MLIGVAFILLSSVLLSWADFSSSSIGTTTAEFLKLGVGARAIGMGEAYSAAADEASALYWNPAALGQLASVHSLSLMHAAYVDSSYFDYFAYAHKGSSISFGTSFQYLSPGEIPRTDVAGNDMGTFTPNDLAFSLGLSKDLLPHLSAGLSLKYIQSTILNTAQTASSDWGVLYQPLKCWKLAFTAFNVGGSLKFHQKSEDLPLLLKVGNALQITDHWMTDLDVGLPRNNNPYIALGTERTWKLTQTWNWAGRLGFNSRTIGSLEGFNGVSAGLGLSQRTISFDYAFLPLGALGYTHRFSLSYGWGSLSDKEGKRISNP